jgi:hypothetical protein
VKFCFFTGFLFLGANKPQLEMIEQQNFSYLAYMALLDSVAFIFFLCEFLFQEVKFSVTDVDSRFFPYSPIHRSSR